MKKIILLLPVFLLLCSCGTDQKTINAMADEMCTAMKDVDQNDQQSLLKAANSLIEISSKEELYKDVTISELESAMKKKCPAGWDNYLLLSEMGSE